MFVLAGDIGGTSTRLRLVEASTAKTIKEERYLSGDRGLAPLVEDFLGTDPKPERACFALAGFVSDNKCKKITNLPWPELDARSLQDELGIAQVSLINDFVAIAYNIVLEEQKNVVTLQTGEYSPDAPIAIIGAGTGLGMAFATPGGGSYRVFPSEGGHANFAPFDQLSDELLQYLRRYNEKVDIEKALSGPGIAEIFRFLRDRRFSGEDAGDFLSQDDPPSAIAQGAADGHFLCQQTMKLFVKIYGSVAGDMALSYLPFGGIYIAGGIAAKNSELMKAEKVAFLQGFQIKEKIDTALLTKFPVHIVLNELEGLTGAVKYACTQM